MFLKSLQLVGFKSFADRTKLDFEPGLTSIVGPNGCGKSNVVDAFRWCLGEMSVKSLRSSQMMDVIFNGSGSRPPQNLSEVTLTFDNSDKRLPIDFSDVSVTRKLFRSGESEYYINKTQCRLRDVRDLFLDTGMGEDGYSSMEQGKVEWILQAKPEERRELFEEAAGVSKYRARREEALRKLDRVEIDLSRIGDIVTVTKDQIRKLENAVTRAKTYERIRGQLKEMEISDWIFQVEHISTDLETNKTKLENLSKEVNEQNTKVHQKEANLAEYRRQMTETEEQLLEANAVLSAIDADIKIGEERVQQAQTRDQELNQQTQNIHETIKAQEDRKVELQTQKEKQSGELLQFKKEGEGIETVYADTKNACDLAHKNLENKSEEIKKTRNFVAQRAQQRAEIQQKISNLTSDVSRIESQIESTKKEIGRIKDEKIKLIQIIKDQDEKKEIFEKQLAQKTNELDSLTNEISQLKDEEQNFQEQLLSQSEKIAKLQGQIHSIKEQQSQDPYLGGTHAILTANIPGVHGPVGSLFQCDESDRDIISAAIGEHLGDLIAETTEDAQRAIKFLSSSGKGRSRIWILERLKKSDHFKDFIPLSKGTPLTDKIRCEERFRPLLSYICGNIRIQDSNIYGEAVINGGVDPSRWQSHVSLRLPELQKALDEQEELKHQLEQEIGERTQIIAEKSLAREDLVKELEEARIRYEMAQEETTKTKERIRLFELEQEGADKELQTRKGEQTQARTNLSEIQNEFNNLEKREKEDHDKLDILQVELTELQRRHADANAELSSKQEQHNSYQEKLQWRQSVVEHSENDFKSIQENLVKHQESIIQIKSEIKIANKNQEEAKTLIETSLNKRNGASEKVSSIQALRVKIAENIEREDGQLSKIRGNVNELQEQLQNKRIEEASLKNKKESIDQKLSDQYEMSWETAKEQFQSTQAVAEDLEKLKKRVSNMGPINLAAPQEHAELSEKCGFLTSQQEDLMKAKNDLKQVIVKINATTREHFRETFQQVKENFQNLYKRLFQGGEADLRLTDEADILSSGVDIFCQPPGKKLLHISLLSGGEKALTAAALLFAFFQVRPSPVCLLDEVDAPLDEANVLRFVDMVKVFSNKTQFLMITHNKRTMEAANTMYGVTMEELGVSKVLSARLQKDKQSPPQQEAPVENATEPATA